ncbi:hypothetical protein Bca52824_093331 [Brassica carinata]|uniref:Uncharacterized protein n=1 Tax=Brassica carinata TaxID=52824 RepID=A0A8X7P629_BRACI|nr:hypothetical protein Bca52824_093331 [Brassica carinata]
MRRSFFIVILTTSLAFFPDPLHGGVAYTGSITPGFVGSQMNYINNNGIFLESNNSDFGFGFVTTPASVTLFTLSIVHKGTSRLICDGASIWESFDHPTDTLITNQAFKQGMKLTSNPSSSNMTYALEIKSGDMVLSLNTLLTPQVYWSMGKERRKIINRDGAVTSSSLLELVEVL